MSVKINEAIAKALARAFGEHGRPNTFSPGELAAHYCKLSPMTIGRAASDGFNIIDINHIMRTRYGWTGSGVMYSKRRFAG